MKIKKSSIFAFFFIFCVLSCAKAQADGASFLEELRSALDPKASAYLQKNSKEILKAFQASDFPQSSYGLALVLHEPKQKTLRFFSMDKNFDKKILKVLNSARKHPSIAQFHLNDSSRCRIQLDFI